MSKQVNLCTNLGKSVGLIVNLTTNSGDLPVLMVKLCPNPGTKPKHRTLKPVC